MKGWNSSKHPILTANQMPAPIHWNPMNEDWKMRLTKSQIYNTSSGFDTQTLDAMKKLHDKILTFGGDEVCMTEFDEDAPKILKRGRFFYGSSYMRKGQDCQCHYNSARLWYKNKDRCFIATGYALALSFLGRSANGTHRSRVGNHRQACCLFRRGFDQRGMRRLCREQHITIGEVTQHG